MDGMIGCYSIETNATSRAALGFTLSRCPSGVCRNPHSPVTTDALPYSADHARSRGGNIGAPAFFFVNIVVSSVIARLCRLRPGAVKLRLHGDDRHPEFPADLDNRDVPALSGLV